MCLVRRIGRGKSFVLEDMSGADNFYEETAERFVRVSVSLYTPIRTGTVLPDGTELVAGDPEVTTTAAP